MATREGCTTGEFAIWTSQAERVFCRVNSRTDRDAERVVAAINRSPEGEPVWPREDPGFRW